MSKITGIEHLRKTADAAKQFINGLVGELARTVTGAVEELEKIKADKPDFMSVTIPSSGWNGDDDANYPKYYDISAAGVTEKDRAEITISPSSLDTAKSCGLCPTNETLAGKIRIRSVSIPTKAISAQYCIENGKE